MWVKNRNNKQGGGVMILVRKDLKVISVDYGMESAELIVVTVDDNTVHKREFVVCYVPPKTRSWSESEYDKLLSDTKSSLTNILRDGRKTVIMGGFNCKEVCWEEMSSEGSETLG